MTDHDELAESLSEKARRYIDDPSEAPDDVEVQEGPQGGLWYETGDSGGSTDDAGVERPSEIQEYVSSHPEEEGAKTVTSLENSFSDVGVEEYSATIFDDKVVVDFHLPERDDVHPSSLYLRREDGAIESGTLRASAVGSFDNSENDEARIEREINRVLRQNTDMAGTDANTVYDVFIGDPHTIEVDGEEIEIMRPHVSLSPDTNFLPPQEQVVEVANAMEALNEYASEKGTLKAKEAIWKQMSMRMFQALADETPAPYVAEVDAPYNDVEGETPDGETKEGDINRKEFRKERVYVDDPSEVPEGYEVQEGPRGGLYYEEDGTSDPSGDDGDQAALQDVENPEGWLQERYPGVDITLNEREPMVGDNDELKLYLVEIPEDQRGQGLGSQIMDDLTAYADANDQRAVLNPNPELGATSRERLVEFYERFGFVENEGEHEHPFIDEEMYRLPGSTADNPRTWDDEKSVSKERVYVDDPSEVPEGFEAQEGSQGGIYYETDSGADMSQEEWEQAGLQILEDFDEDDYRWDYWGNGSNYDALQEGTIVEIDNLETFEQEQAVVIEADPEAGQFAVVTENGEMELLDRDAVGEETPWMLTDYWDAPDKDNIREGYDDTPDREAQQEQRQQEIAEGERAPHWASDDPLAEVEESPAPEGGLEDGGLYRIDGDIEALERVEDYPGDVPVYETEHIKYSAIDGVLCRAGDPNDISTGDVQYIDFADEAEFSDGWYHVAEDMEQRDDDDPNSIAWTLWNEEEGLVTVPADGVFDSVDGVHKPRENAYAPQLEATPEPAGSPNPDDWSIDWTKTDDGSAGKRLPMAEKKLLMQEWKAAVDTEAAEGVSETIRAVKDSTYNTHGQKYDKLIKAVMGAEGNPREGDFEAADDPTDEEVEAMRVLQQASQKFFEEHYGERADIHRGLAEYSHEQVLPSIAEMFSQGEELSGTEIELHDNPAGVWTTHETAARAFTIAGSGFKSLVVSDEASKDEVFNMPDAIYPYEEREETVTDDSDWDESEVNIPSNGKTITADDIMVVNAYEEETTKAPLPQVLNDPASTMADGNAPSIARFLKTLDDMAPELYEEYVAKLQADPDVTGHDDYDVIERQIEDIEYDPNESILFDSATKQDDMSDRIVLDVRSEADTEWLQSLRDAEMPEKRDRTEWDKEAELRHLMTQLDSDLGKKRVYIDSPDDAPEGVDVQQGPQGGLYYETDDLPDDAQADEPSPADGRGTVDWNQARVQTMAAKLNAQFGPQITQSFMRHTADVIQQVDPVMVQSALAGILSDDEPEMDVGVKKQLHDAAVFHSILKGRRYVDDPSEVPEGYEPQEGPQGGIYYEIDGDEESGSGSTLPGDFDADEWDASPGRLGDLEAGQTLLLEVDGEPRTATVNFANEGLVSTFFDDTGEPHDVLDTDEILGVSGESHADRPSPEEADSPEEILEAIPFFGDAERLEDRVKERVGNNVAHVKDDEMAKRILDHIKQFESIPGRAHMDGAAGSSKDRATLNVGNAARPSTINHEFGHISMDAFGYGLGGWGAREAIMEYDSEEDTFISVDPESQDHRIEYKADGDPDPRMARLAEAVNQGWQRLQEGGPERADDYRMKSNYSACNAHEFMAELHEAMQSDHRPSPDNINWFDNHPDLLPAYTEVFDPSDTMKELISYLHEDRGDDSPFDTNPYPEHYPDETGKMWKQDEEEEILEIRDYYRVWIDDPNKAPEQTPVHHDPNGPGGNRYYYEVPLETVSTRVAIDEEKSLKKAVRWGLSEQSRKEYPERGDLVDAGVPQKDLTLIDKASTQIYAGLPLFGQELKKSNSAILKDVESPLTLLNLYKKLYDQGEEYSAFLNQIQKELKRRGVYGFERVAKARRYIQDPSEAPADVQVQEGPQGGLWYETEGSSSSESESETRSEVAVDTPDLSPEQQKGLEKGIEKARENGLLENVEGFRDDRPPALLNNDPIASFNPATNEIYINPDKATEENLNKLGENGYLVGGSIVDTVIHECIHAAHYNSMTEDEAAEVMTANLGLPDKNIIEVNTSRYAAEMPIEAVAEIGTKMIRGDDISDTERKVYDKFMGPEL